MSVVRPIPITRPSFTTLANNQAELDDLGRSLSMQETWLRLKHESLRSDIYRMEERRQLAVELEDVRVQMSAVESHKHEIMICLASLCRTR